LHAGLRRRLIAVNGDPHTNTDRPEQPMMAVEPNVDCRLSLLARTDALVDYTQRSGLIHPPQRTVWAWPATLPSRTGPSARNNQINLTDWYPFIVPFAKLLLILVREHPCTRAKYDVYVMVEDPVVGTARAGGRYGTPRITWRRTFVLSASDSYQVEESAVGPVQIETYSFPGHADANKAVMWMATQSLGLYQAKFAPYPYQSLSIVETEMADGQEYDGLVFLASKFYTDYNGSANSNLFSMGPMWRIGGGSIWWSDQADKPVG
jgi:hypothetical protein